MVSVHSLATNEAYLRLIILVATCVSLEELDNGDTNGFQSQVYVLRLGVSCAEGLAL